MQTPIHCPSCRAENAPDASVCVVCGSRVFAWLGDFFGTQDTAADRALPDVARSIYSGQSTGSAAASAASGPAVPASPSTTVRASFPVNKGFAAALLTVAVLMYSQVGGTLVGFCAALILLFWPRISWARFIVVLAALAAVQLLIPGGRGVP